MNKQVNQQNKEEYSRMLKIKSLEKEFELKLTKYKEQYDQYIGNINKNINSYIILGVGVDGALYIKYNLDDDWIKVNDSSKDLQSITTTINGGGSIMAVDKNNNIITKQKYSDNSWTTLENSCCVLKAMETEDGRIFGLGTDNKLYLKESKDVVEWTGPINTFGEELIDFTVCPDGSVLSLGKCVDGGNKLYIHEKVNNLNSPWKFLEDETFCCICLTVAPDGKLFAVNDKNSLVYKEDYKNLNTNWIELGGKSCCMKSITTIEQNYLSSSSSASSSLNNNDKELYKNLKSLNDQLQSLSSQLQNELNYKESEVANNDYNYNDLVEIHQQLIQDRLELESLVKTHQTIDSASKESEINVSRTQYIYYVLIFIAALIVFYTLKSILFSSKPPEIPYQPPQTPQIPQTMFGGGRGGVNKIFKYFSSFFSR